MDRRRTAGTAVLLIALASGVAAVSEPPRERRKLAHVPPLLPRAELVYALGGPARNLVADYYWIRTTHATGVAKTADDYRDIYDYVNLVIELDPDFRYAYLFGGSTVAFNLGRETWVNTRESTDLLERGARRFPTYVMLQMLYAYNLSTFEKRYHDAAAVLERTARLPDAPRYLAALATRLYAQGGDFNAGIALASAIAANAEDPETREAFERRKLELILEERLKLVDAAVQRFQAREGRRPETLRDLVRAGDLSAIPEDPLGGEIVIDADGLGFSTAQKRRLKIYTPGDRG